MRIPDTPRDAVEQNHLFLSQKNDFFFRSVFYGMVGTKSMKMGQVKALTTVLDDQKQNSKKTIDKRPH